VRVEQSLSTRARSRRAALVVFARRLVYRETTCAAGACTTMTCGCACPPIPCGMDAAAACRSFTSRLTWHCKQQQKSAHDRHGSGALTPTRYNAFLYTLAL
tara:strand:+ start:142 stop:444 length:303 start_codon:yes stop_codon:yes gene_type:complete